MELTVTGKRSCKVKAPCKKCSEVYEKEFDAYFENEKIGKMFMMCCKYHKCNIKEAQEKFNDRCPGYKEKK